jgi:tRNA1(Val) A37 N6-methylase TrmN6
MSLPTTRKPKAGTSPTGGTSTDDFLGGRLSVVQPRAGHRAGSDAVFLAAAVPAKSGERVLDIGAGVGVAGLCLVARVPGIHVTAVEIGAGLCALAAENAARNGLAARVEIVTADVTSPGKVLSAAGLERESYHQLIANPPFHAEGTVRAAPDAARASAHVMDVGGLAAWVRFSAAMAAPNARLTLIHRPDCLGLLLEQLAGRFGGITVFPLFPKRDEPASRILVQAKKGSKAGLSLLPGLVLHEEDGSYTAAAESILRGGGILTIASSGKRKGHRLGGVRRQPFARA